MFDDADDDLEQLPDSLKALAVEAEAAAAAHAAAAAAAEAGPAGDEYIELGGEDGEEEFEPAPAFDGPRDGMVFKSGGKGNGYYPDKVTPPHGRYRFLGNWIHPRPRP